MSGQYNDGLTDLMTTKNFSRTHYVQAFKAAIEADNGQTCEALGESVNIAVRRQHLHRLEKSYKVGQ